jgi:hypothetical protein
MAGNVRQPLLEAMTHLVYSKDGGGSNWLFEYDVGGYSVQRQESGARAAHCAHARCVVFLREGGYANGSWVWGRTTHVFDGTFKEVAHGDSNADSSGNELETVSAAN